MATPTIQIDPNTGERVRDAAPIQAGAVQIDPNTGERVTPTPPIAAQPGNAWTSGHPLDTLRANYDEAMRPYTPQEVEDNGAGSTILHGIGRGFTGTLLTPLLHPLDTLKGIGKMAVNPVGAGEDMGNAAIQDFKNNGMIQALPNLLGQAGGAMIGGKLIGGRSLPGNPSLVDPIADTARAAAADIGVPNPTAFETGLKNIGPDLKRFARDSGTPLNTGGGVFERNPDIIRNVSTLSDQYGDHLAAHYKTLLDTADKTPPVDIGDIGHPRYINIENLDGVARDLNKQIGDAQSIPEYAERNAAIQKLKDSGIWDEAGRASNALNNAVARANGLSYDQVSNLRQSIAHARDIASQADIADQNIAGRIGNRQRGQATTTDARGSAAMTGIRAIGRGLKGSERVAAGRYLANTLDKLPEANTPLPQPQAPRAVNLPSLTTEQRAANAQAQVQRFTRAPELPTNGLPPLQ